MLPFEQALTHLKNGLQTQNIHSGVTNCNPAMFLNLVSINKLPRGRAPEVLIK
jgi:hypothetical protein